MMANGFPSSPGYQKTLGNQCYRRLCKKCRRLNSDQRKWWAQFIENERRYRNKWSAVTEEYLCEAKRNRWYLDKGQLKRHKPVSELKKQDQDQQQHKHNLENLLSKSNQFPPIRLTASFSLVLALVRDRYSVSYFQLQLGSKDIHNISFTAAETRDSC